MDVQCPSFKALAGCVNDDNNYNDILSIIDYSHIVLIIAIWPGDRIRWPEHSTVEHGSCNESV